MPRQEHQKIEKYLMETAEPIAKLHGVYVYDAEYTRIAGSQNLHIYLHTEKGGITFDICEAVNNALSEIIDAADVIAGHYVLEVSSRGIPRKLRRAEHYEEAVGEKIKIKLYSPYNNSKTHSGLLHSVNGSTIFLDTGKEIIPFELDNIAKCETVYEFK